MPYPTPARWNPAAGPAKGAGRVEVWSRGEQVADVDCSELISASVTDKYATGVRRSLQMRVEPTAKWLRMAKLPGLEVRPFAGFNWGRSEFLCPMGRFPILPPALSLPASEISFDADDYWQWVVDYTFPIPRDAYTYQIPYAAALLIMEAKAGSANPEIRTLNQTPMPKIQWDRNAHEAIAQAMESIGCEAFMDRNGVPIIQEVATVTGPPLTTGDDGTIIEIQSSSDWSDVKNAITVTSNNDDVVFPPVEMAILDPEHPAAAWRIGTRPSFYESPLFADVVQASLATPALLFKRAIPAESWSVTALPDPSRDSGDTIVMSTDLGTQTNVIQQVEHDLGGAPMKLTLGAAMALA